MTTDPRAATVAAFADALLSARRSHTLVVPPGTLPDAAAAYAVQEATFAALGPHGAWKVGARSRDAEPSAAPIPQACILAPEAPLTGPAWQLRGVEVECGVRLGRDLGADAAGRPAAELLAAVDAVVPVVEIVETRWQDWRAVAPLALLADLGSHGGLIIGAPLPPTAERLDLRQAAARLQFGDELIADTRGAHSAPDLGWLLGWLAGHAAARGRPLRAGDVVTTGSLTGMPFSPAGTVVRAELAGAAPIQFRF
jgi:2-keto-4-pentenoate hydratase